MGYRAWGIFTAVSPKSPTSKWVTAFEAAFPGDIRSCYHYRPEYSIYWNYIIDWTIEIIWKTFEIKRAYRKRASLHWHTKLHSSLGMEKKIVYLQKMDWRWDRGFWWVYNQELRMNIKNCNGLESPRTWGGYRTKLSEIGLQIRTSFSWPIVGINRWPNRKSFGTWSFVQKSEKLDDG